MATIEDIFNAWNEDSIINRVELGNAALDIPKLHNKYYRMLSSERLRLKKMKSQMDILVGNKKDWLTGNLSKEELDQLGWTPYLRKLLKSELDDFIKVDPDFIEFNIKLAVQEEKLEILDSIIKMISNRSFQISNAINFEKFRAGM